MKVKIKTVETYQTSVEMKSGRTEVINHVAPAPYASATGFFQIISEIGDLFSFNAAEVAMIRSVAVKSHEDEIEVPDKKDATP